MCFMTSVKDLFGGAVWVLLDSTQIPYKMSNLGLYSWYKWLWAWLSLKAQLFDPDLTVHCSQVCRKETESCGLDSPHSAIIV